MRTDDPASIRDLLDQAEVLADTYADYDTEAARRRVNAKAGPPSSAPGAATPGPDHATSGPEVPRPPAAHEQAARDLDLAVALIVDTPQAATALARLADDDRPDPEGAVVFGALLHLTRDYDGAQFWWQFAAGGGNRTAAFCLSLAHGRRAEFSDARHWRAQARRLTGPDSDAPAVPARPLLPECIRHQLLTQCRSGSRPTLPARLEAVINRLPVDPDHDFGTIPRPVPTLTHDLPHSHSHGHSHGHTTSHP
ncbi:hypothetical protein [Streptomyces sp. NPDC006645]|uniref:hypothetical protein n=1 Tax=unclassified Streptomyces TaxID=2593676 RepID=UPI0033AFEC04